MTDISRWPSSSPGRSHTVSAAGFVWTVANARDAQSPFARQVDDALAMLDAHLQQAGAARTHLLSVQVLLADIGNRGAFDARWREWIGTDPAHWPQRAVLQAVLAPGLQVELLAVAAPSGWTQQTHPAPSHN